MKVIILSGMMTLLRLLLYRMDAVSVLNVLLQHTFDLVAMHTQLKTLPRRLSAFLTLMGAVSVPNVVLQPTFELVPVPLKKH